MNLIRMRIEGEPPFTEPVKLKLDERVNVFVGPNASGKSTVLLMLADCLVGKEEKAKRPIARGMGGSRSFILTVDDECDEVIEERTSRLGIANFLTASADWVGTYAEPKRQKVNPPIVHIGSVREGLPGISEVGNWDVSKDDADDILQMPFTGPLTVRAYAALGAKLWSEDPSEAAPYARVELMDAGKLADDCSKTICDEVIVDSQSHNYIPDPYALEFLHHPQADPGNIQVLRMMGINTNDVRNFENLPLFEQPSEAAYRGYEDQPPIYLGHLSSGTEGTLLWIRWLALKMLCHYDFAEGWEKLPAILLIDEIENHLHPTWQRRVIPSLLEHFPGLQIFATTHSPFVVAGLKAGQVHLLNRDANGVVTASTNAEDIVGWTADEILRTMMGVQDPTDDETARNAAELRRLRDEGPRGTPDAEEGRQKRMQQLRRLVDRDLLAGGPMAARRELFEKQFNDALEKYRQSRDLGQENG